MFIYEDKDREATAYLEERDKKHIFEILEMLERRINALEKDTKGRELLKSLIDTYSHVCELADDYPFVKLELMDNSKMWDIAKDFIISKDMKEEFNTYCDKHIKNEMEELK